MTTASHTAKSTHHVSLPTETTIGTARLSVADAERSIAFYRDFLGFELLDQQGDLVTLGVAGKPVLELVVVPNLHPRVHTSAGLFHVAILMPTRVALAEVLSRILAANYPLGAGDHFVSEALYLNDPDENGLEIYADRPRPTWKYRRDGTINMGTVTLDLASILQELPDNRPVFGPMAAGTIVGHVHLQVGSIQEAQAFYCDILGFDVMTPWPGALFISAGGYHHHIGMNTWQSLGAKRGPANTANLLQFEVVLPDAASVAAVYERVTAAGLAARQGERSFEVDDPWGTTVKFVTAS